MPLLSPVALEEGDFVFLATAAAAAIMAVWMATTVYFRAVRLLPIEAVVVLTTTAADDVAMEVAMIEAVAEVDPSSFVAVVAMVGLSMTMMSVGTISTVIEIEEVQLSYFATQAVEVEVVPRRMIV